MIKDRHEWFIFTGISTFMESDYIKEIKESKNYDITFVGIPTDAWVSYRRWAMYGPKTLRELSCWEKLNGKEYLDTSSGENKRTNQYTVCDAWDIFLSRDSIGIMHDEIYRTIKEVRQYSFPLIVWGDHSIAYSTIRWCIEASGIPKERIGILHIDAHCDTEENCLWLNKYHHWAPFRLLIDEWHIIGKNLYTIGPRWMLPISQIEYAKAQWINLHLMPNIRKTGFETFLANILNELSQKFEAIYVTLDVDGMDPSDMRGTWTPVEGWFYAHEIEKLVRSLSWFNIIGFEMVELAPEFDSSWYSTIVASNILWQFLAFWLKLTQLWK